MRRPVTGLLASLLLLSGCVATPGPSGPPGPSASLPTPSPSAGPSTSPNASPAATPSASSPAATVEPTAEPQPTVAPFPTDVVAQTLPDGIGRIAWGGMQVEMIDEGHWRGHLHGGLLGAGPTIEATIEQPVDSPNPVVAGDVVAAVSAARPGHLRVRGWDASDGIAGFDLDVVGADVKVVLDPGRRLVYTVAGQAGGGVEIRRRSFDGAIDDLLVTLDKRFAPTDAFPNERYDALLDPDGILLVEACGEDDGCRLWEIPPGAAVAPKPRTLPAGTAPLCQMLAATADWLIVQDIDACYADTGEAPLPVSAIRRSDGASHHVTDDHVSIGRVVEIDGRTLLIGADGIVAGASIDLVSYDVVTGAKRVIARHLGGGADDAGLTVDGVSLPGAWVLIRPWFIDGPALPSVPARLFDVATGETIELPVGTFGW